MKLARGIFIFCLLIAAPLPFMIGSAVFPYELLLFFVFIIVIKKGLFRSAKKKLNNGYSIKNIIITGILFISSILIGLILSYVDNLKIVIVDNFMMIKTIVHVILTIFVLAGAFTCGFSLFKGEQDLLLVSWVLFFAFFLIALQTDVAWIIETGGVISRYNFEPPSGLGQGDTSKVCILGLLFAFFIYIKTQKPAQKIFIVFSFFVIGLSIITIQSRAGYLTAIVQFFALLYFINKNKKDSINFSLKAVIIFFALAFLGFIFYAIFYTNLSQSLGEMTDVENSQSINRLLAIMDAIRMFTENPFFGVGWGHFVLHTQIVMTVSGIGHVVNSPHNGLAQLLGETGAIGTILALVISYLILKKIWIIKQNVIQSDSKIFLGLIFFILLMIIVTSFAVSSYLFPPPVQRESVRPSFYYWFLIGYSLSFMKNYQIKTV
jgi:O-antigen ligase